LRDAAAAALKAAHASDAGRRRSKGRLKETPYPFSEPPPPTSAAVAEVKLALLSYGVAFHSGKESKEESVCS